MVKYYKIVLFIITIIIGCTSNKDEPKIINPAAKPLRNADYFITVAESVNIRVHPSTKSKSIAKLNSGILVIFIEDTKKEEVISGKKSSWLKIELNDGNSGYVFGGFVIPKKEAFKRILSKDNSLENRKFELNTTKEGQYFIFGGNNSISLEGECLLNDPEKTKTSTDKDVCSKKGIYQKIGNYVFINIDNEELLMEIAPLPDNQEEYALRQIEPASGSREDIFYKEIK